MMRRNTILLVVMCAGMILPKFATAAALPTTRELLTQYVVELQKSPDDQALRERIIKLGLTLSPSPTVPEEAKHFLVKATIYQKEASDIEGYEQLALSAREFAIAAYKDALLIAPWWPEAYYGLGTSLEAAGQFKEAVAVLNLYILTEPDPAGVRAAREKLSALAVKRDQASAKP